jgi:hypothetical protein
MVVTAFSSVVHFGVGSSFVEELWGCQPIEVDGVGSAETFESLDRDEAGITGSCADQKDLAYVFW